MPSSAEAEAPGPPAKPSSFLFGVVVVNNSSGWDSVIHHDQGAGALVLGVVPGSPAAGAGVEAGDIIISVDDAEIRNSEQVTVAFRSKSNPSHRVILTKPDGRVATIEIKLADAASVDVAKYIQDEAAAHPGAISRFLLAQQTADDAEASAILDDLAAKSPSFAEAHALKAQRLLATVDAAQTPGAAVSSRLETARAEIDKAEELDQSSASIRTTGARISLELQDVAKARDEASLAADLDDFFAEAHYVLGTVRFADRQTTQGLTELRRAVDLDPYDLEYYTALAIAFIRTGNRNNAAKTIESAKSFVTDAGVKQRLDQVLTASGSVQSNQSAS